MIEFKKYRIKVNDFAEKGETIGKVAGMPVYVPFAIPGEEIEVKITEVRRNFARGKILQILRPVSSRVEPPCPYFYSCGGCQWQHINYLDQLSAKRTLVQRALEGMNKSNSILVKEPIRSRQAFHYRNKIQQPVRLKNGEIITGFYYPGTHRVLPIEECRVQSSLGNQIVQEVIKLLPRFDIPPYHEKSHTGILRYVYLREGVYTHEVMLILVVNAAVLPQLEPLAKEIMIHFPELVSVFGNVNMQRTNIILGSDYQLISGQPFIHEKITNMQFRISPESFFQVNPDGAHEICKVVERFAELTGKEQVIDLFCGVGLIGLYLARQADKVYGIENVKKAIEDARQNAMINQIQNIQFVCADTEKGLAKLKMEAFSPSVIVLDPPRQGCNASTLALIADLAPNKIIYVSCELKTLKRDLEVLAGYGYEAVEIQPVDLFPQTAHVECVVKIVKRNLF